METQLYKPSDQPTAIGVYSERGICDMLYPFTVAPLAIRVSHSLRAVNIVTVL